MNNSMGETKFLAPKVCNKNKCCIVIPTHKEKLDGNDELSFKRCIDVFGGKREIKLVVPNSIDTKYYEQYGDVIKIYKVNDKWLSSIKEYNYMCCNIDFWSLFKDYDYVLIYQTDCWVFDDRLDYFMGLDYDWYGAPWPHLKDKVGNGGFFFFFFSKMLSIAQKYTYKSDSIEGVEDTWFCVTHSDELNICDLHTACNFSIENITNKYLTEVDNIPMGLHGKFVLNLWDENGNKFLKLK